MFYNIQLADFRGRRLLSLSAQLCPNRFRRMRDHERQTLDLSGRLWSVAEEIPKPRGDSAGMEALHGQQFVDPEPRFCELGERGWVAIVE
jgi:hypothetical protein